VAPLSARTILGFGEIVCKRFIVTIIHIIQQQPARTQLQIMQHKHIYPFAMPMVTMPNISFAAQIPI
jgi:hypothetical protein